MSENNVMVLLTRAEALVLFEWLARTDASNALAFEDKAEQTVLWKLEGVLEKLLPEVLAPDYKRLLSSARQEVQGPAND
ncbi:MAG: hypothetical protein ACYC8T_14380 [Myxococcaceae bacterium]